MSSTSPPSAPTLLDRGSRVAGYRIERVLGAGGMGIVYEATQLSLDRRVALKLLLSQIGTDGSFQARFRREARVQAALDHPNIVAVHEAGESEHGLFIAMRLVKGRNLKDMILAREIDPARARRILGPVADALDAAHAAGLIHRDIKPQNVLVAGRDHPYLADFGLTQPEDATALTATGQFVGTVDYIPPEQIRAEEVTPRSDVYALAAVLYECLAGVVPFPKPSMAALLFAHLSETPPRVTDLRPELPAALDQIIARGMAKDPSKRPATAGELIGEALRALDPGTRPWPAAATAPAASPVRTTEGPAHGGPASRRRRWAKRPALRMLVVGTALAAAAGALLGDGDAPAGPRAARSSVAVDGLELSYPASWERTTRATRIEGLALRGQMGLVRAGRAGQSLAAGVSDAEGPTLLSAGFVESLREPLPRPQAVRLGRLEAYRYEGLRQSSREVLTVYAIPTTRGVATVACRAAPSDGAFFRACGQVAATVKIAEVDAFGLGPNDAYADALDRALSRLDSELTSSRLQLRTATTPAGQARIAALLAAAYSDAERQLDRATVSPADRDLHARMLRELRSASRGYRALNRAAGRSDSAAHASAKRTIGTAERRLERVLEELGERGYRLV